MSRRSSIDYVWGLLVLSFIESSILTIRCVFILFLVFKLDKLYKSSLQLIHIILNHLILLSSVDIGDYLVVACFGRWILSPAYLLDVFFVTCKLYMSCLYIILCLGNGKCFIWKFLVLAFIKSANLTTTYFFQPFSMIWKWHNSSL